jgi:hypothetical protein
MQKSGPTHLGHWQRRNSSCPGKLTYSSVN